MDDPIAFMTLKVGDLFRRERETAEVWMRTDYFLGVVVFEGNVGRSASFSEDAQVYPLDDRFRLTVTDERCFHLEVLRESLQTFGTG